MRRRQLIAALAATVVIPQQWQRSEAAAGSSVFSVPIQCIEDPMGPAAKRDEGRTRPEGPAPLSPGEAVLVIGVLSAL